MKKGTHTLIRGVRFRKPSSLDLHYAAVYEIVIEMNCWRNNVHRINFEAANPPDHPQKSIKCS